jgi:hypothetical protein
MTRFADRLAIACLLLTSCKGAQAPAPPPVQVTSAPPSAVSRFFPLVDGTQWAYDAEEDGTTNKGLFVTRAKAAGAGRFTLVTGQRSHTIEVRSDGIARVDTGNYVLRAPLTAGATWPGEGGAMVRVGAVDTMVTVPAGQFVGCVETVEELRKSTDALLRRVTTTYCPDVGIVSLHAEAWEGARHQGERAVLRSFGKPVTIE